MNDGLYPERSVLLCSTPVPKTNEELIKRYKKRVDVGDAQAMFGLGCISMIMREMACRKIMYAKG